MEFSHLSPLLQRAFNTIAGLTLLLWGGYGLYVSDLVIPALHVLQPLPGYLMFSAFTCGAMVLTSIIIDCYDVKTHEPQYPGLARYVATLGWLLLGAALLIHWLIQGHLT